MSWQRWTRLTPWTVIVSPLDDPAMPLICICEFAADAAAMVREHNALCIPFEEVAP